MRWSPIFASSVPVRASSESEHVDVENQQDDDNVNSHPAEDNDVEQTLSGGSHGFCIWLPGDLVNVARPGREGMMTEAPGSIDKGLLAWLGPAIFGIVTIGVLAFFWWFL